jgi:hypothetical protein
MQLPRAKALANRMAGFVARFKYPAAQFLARNFSVEEYFARLQSGEGPLSVLQSKG